MSKHPDDQALLAWAAGDGHKLTDHVHGCDVCLERLDELTSLDGSAQQMLRRVVRPDPGFWERVELARRRRTRALDVWSALADLNSLSWRTWTVLTKDDDE